MGGVVLKNPKTGEEQFFNASEIPKAIRGGWVASGPGGIPLVNNDGTTTVISPDALQEAALGREGNLQVAGEQRSRQLREQRETEIAFGGAPIRAGLLGAARTATFGLSDVIGAKAGFGEEIRDFRSANPGASVFGEVAGALGPGLLSGGTGLAGTLARATPAGKLFAKTAPLSAKGMAPAAAAGAIEGAAFGTGQALSNLAISDAPFTGEAVFDVIKGGLFGAGLGAGAGLIGEGLFRGGSKLAQGMRKQQKDEIFEATTANFDNLGAIERQVREGSRLGNAAKYFDDIRVPGSIDDFAQGPRSVAKLIDERADVLKQNIEQARSLIKNSQEPAVVAKLARELDLMQETITQRVTRRVLDKDNVLRNKTTEKVLSFGRRPHADIDDLNKSFTGFAKSLDDIYARAGITKQASDGVKLTNSLEDFFKKNPIKVTASQQFKQLDDLKASIGKRFGLNRDFKFTPASAKRIEKMSMEEITDGLADFNDYVKELNRIGGEGIAAQLDDMMSAYRDKLNTLLPEGTDIGTALVLFGAEETLLPDFLPGPVDDLAKAILAFKLAGGLGKTGKGTVRKIWEQAQFRSLSRAGEREGRKAFGHSGAAVGFTLGGMLSRKMASGVDGIANIGHSAAAKLRSSVAKFAKGTGRVTKKAGHVTALSALNAISFAEGKHKKEKDLETAFEKRRDEITNLMSNPEAMQMFIHERTAEVRGLNMMVGDNVAGTGLRALQVIAAAIPPEPSGNMVFGKNKFKHPASVMRKFASTVFGATQPGKFIEQAFGAGPVNADAAKAFQQVYPAHLAKIQEHIAENIEAYQKLPFKKRTKLSIMFSIPVEPLMTKIGQTQQSFVDAAAQDASGNANPGVTMQGNSPTKAQELQAR